jgi:hypothetical protein
MLLCGVLKVPSLWTIRIQLVHRDCPVAPLKHYLFKVYEKRPSVKKCDCYLSKVQFFGALKELCHAQSVALVVVLRLILCCEGDLVWQLDLDLIRLRGLAPSCMAVRSVKCSAMMNLTIQKFSTAHTRSSHQESDSGQACRSSSLMNSHYFICSGVEELFSTQH